MSATDPRSGRVIPAPAGAGSPHDGLPELSLRLLQCGHATLSREPFFGKVSDILLEHSGCAAIAIRTFDGLLGFHWRAERGGSPALRLEAVPEAGSPAAAMRDAEAGPAAMERLCRSMLPEGAGPAGVSARGSCWSASGFAAIGFTIEQNSHGVMWLRGPGPEYFDQARVEFYEAVAQTLGIVIAGRRRSRRLRERVKELTCLYGIARLAGDAGSSFETVLEGVVRLLPPAWQYPEIATARILVDGRAYVSDPFAEGPFRQFADIVVEGDRVGLVEIFYTEERPDLRIRPFLDEERSLLDTVAQEVALIVLHKQAEEQRARLEAQLRHADRLATIGQLAAGVAHELNEPLNGILGFSQLVMKAPDLPRQPREDVEKILKASLHAREVVRKLMLFSRQIPPRTQKADLNQVVNEGLYFLESRCAKAGIELIRDMAAEPPPIEADVSQIHQVLVNLVVNAVQAMPEGGRLTVRTERRAGEAVLSVEDTGTGMTDEVRRRIFTPFFTTKDVGQGTGLGLAVVHGIVRAHGGSIHVESRPGEGSRFEVRLPVPA
jgi:signal transduction histidine kinase